MAGPNEINVGLDVLEEETGVWCEPCALPSGVALRLAITINDRPAGVVRRAVCQDCGGTIE